MSRVQSLYYNKKIVKNIKISFINHIKSFLISFGILQNQFSILLFKYEIIAEKLEKNKKIIKKSVANSN